MPKLNLTDIDNTSYKGINWADWGGIDNFLRETSTGASGTAKPQLLRRVLPWLAKATSMTALAVSQLPFEIRDDRGDIFDTSSDWRNRLGGITSPDKLLYNIAASLCLGKAYIIPSYTDRMIADLHFCAPHTVSYIITKDGLQSFSRTSDYGQAGVYAPLGMYEQVPAEMAGEMMYFWLSDPDVEIGPAKTYPAGAALLASELIASMDSTMKATSERGFVPPTLLSVKGVPPQAERERVENWFNRFLRRWTDTPAKIINADAMDVKQIGAGMDALRGTYSELKKSAIEDIGTSFGIPAALFMSDMAFASEVNPLIKVWYSTSAFIQIYHTIEHTFNDQLLSKWGLTLKFRPETLDAFQENEQQRSQNFATYRNAGVKPSIAAQMVGLEMPEGMTYADLDVDIAPEPKVTERVDVAQAPKSVTLNAGEIKELDLWRQMAIRWYRKGRSPAVDFECKTLGATLADPIRAKLASAKSELDVVKAFEVGPAGVREDNLKALADALNNLAVPAKTGDEMQIIINNPTKVETTSKAQLKAMDVLTQRVAALGNDVREGILGINIPAPVVNVAAPEVKVDVAAAQAPVVNVKPEIKVDVPAGKNVINLPKMRKSTQKVKRDGQGNATGTETVFDYEE